jgi:RNA-directed DNA polymerase
VPGQATDGTGTDAALAGGPAVVAMKRAVWGGWEAWRRVRANRGAPGVGGRDVEEFEADLADSLDRVCTRMGSGSYLAPPVGAVEIPKPHGDGVRRLGGPTIAEGIARTVVAMHLEDRADHRFAPDSYGYRPGKSAPDALAECRPRRWKHDRVIDLDVRRFFDEVPAGPRGQGGHGGHRRPPGAFVCRAVAGRPARAPGRRPRAAKQGNTAGVGVSPILANLFVPHAFDPWMAGNFPGCPFERYADDVVVHGTSRRQAEYVLARIAARRAEIGLRLHPDKTPIVYRKDGRRRAEHEHTSLTFFGYACGARGRAARTAGSSPAFRRRSAPRRSGPRASSSAGCGATGAPTRRSTAWRGG